MIRRGLSAIGSIFKSVSTLANPAAWLSSWFNGDGAAGPLVTESTALQNPTVWACVRLISESLATVPLDLYRRAADGSKVEASELGAYSLIHDRPNEHQTAVEWREMMIGQAALTGAGRSRIVRDGRGEPVALVPLLPEFTRCLATSDGAIFFDTRDIFGAHRRLSREDVFELRYASRNVLTPLSPIGLHRETIALSESCKQHGSKLFTHGARLGGLFSWKPKLSTEQLALYRDSFQATHAGPENQHKFAFLDQDVAFTPMSMSSEDAQFLQTRQYQRAEIAAIYRCPLPMIGDLTHATYSNHEQQALAFVVHTLRPWAVRFEQAIARDLLGGLTAGVGVFAEHNLDGLLRGDINARYTAYTRGIQWGFLSPNDVRAMENLPPIEGGQTYIVPANMLPLVMSGGRSGADVPLLPAEPVGAGGK